MDKELEKTKNRILPCPESSMERISLFPGIELYIFSARTEMISIQHPKPDHIMEINYCRSGRVGWSMRNGTRIYLGPGDFSLHTPDACAKTSLYFPTEKYEGMTFCIHLPKLSAHPPAILADTGISGELLYEKFCKNNAVAFFGGNEQTEAIFSAFYGQPETIRLACQKVKTLELLLYLFKMEAGQATRPTEYQSDQIEIVRAVHDQLIQNIGQRITIEALSKQYLMNATTLKEVFKSVYGTSIAAHIKEHRMEQAARLLLETDLKLAEIGQQIGYESQSRFTAAFKEYYQMLPREYRKTHRRNYEKVLHR